MFYSHDILQRRGGKFGIIWIAATRAVSLNKRDYFSVSVAKTCDDILLYVNHQSGGSKPRLSLYLSSQLMYGVTSVYQKQYEYLFVEVRDLHRRFSTSKLSSRIFQGLPAADIELPKRVRRAVDAVTLPEPTYEKYDSDFGLMRLEEGALEPFLLPTIEMFSLSPSRSQPITSESPHETPKRRRRLEPDFQKIRSPHTVSSTDEITLKEDAMISPRAQEIAIPGEQDLPPLDGDVQFEQLLQDIQPLEGGIPETFADQGHLGVTSPVREEQMWTMDDKTGEVILSPVRPKRKPKRGQKTKQKDGARLDDLEAGISPVVSSDQGVMEGLPTDQGVMEGLPSAVGDNLLEKTPFEDRPEMHTPKAPAVIPILRLAPLNEEAETPSPARRHRKRRLVFADDVLRLSKDDLRNNLSTADDLSLPEEQRFAVAVKQVTVKEMFEMPARKAMVGNPTFMTKWRKLAVCYKSGYTSYSDEETRPVWSTEYLRERPPMEGSSDSQEKSEQQRQAADASTEFLRDVSGMDSTLGLRKHDETPVSMILSDVSNLSEEKSRGSTSGAASGLRSQRPALLRPDDIIPEEDKTLQDDQIMMSMGEVLLQDAGLMAHESDVIVEDPGLISVDPGLIMEDGMPIQENRVHEAGLDNLHDLMEGQRKSWWPKSPEQSTSEEEPEDAVPHDSVFKHISGLIEDSDYTTFEELVPLTTYKQVAAKIFNICLEYGARQLIHIDQASPYDTITIGRGRRYYRQM